MSEAILVTGGAGYIGSHTVLELVRSGREVVVVDDLSKGHAQALRTPNFIRGDIADRSVLERAFSAFPITRAIHFAAQSLVAESMSDPRKY
ncbi:NAD-dependent epimerase/dehydratase family protein, partial [Thermodesulfobacteriota bacterium]